MNPVEYASNVPGWMMPEELAWLSKKAASLRPGAQWLEVGTWMGKSWSCVALSLPARSTIIAVDPFDGGTGSAELAALEGGSTLTQFLRTHNAVTALRPDLKTRIICELSSKASGSVPDGSCDVIFIDGDHRPGPVRDDLAAWTPKLKSGGLLCGHDIDESGVKEALNGRPYSFDPLRSGGIWWLV